MQFCCSLVLSCMTGSGTDAATLLLSHSIIIFQTIVFVLGAAMSPSCVFLSCCWANCRLPFLFWPCSCTRACRNSLENNQMHLCTASSSFVFWVPWSISSCVALVLVARDRLQEFNPMTHNARGFSFCADCRWKSALSRSLCWSRVLQFFLCWLWSTRSTPLASQLGRCLLFHCTAETGLATCLLCCLGDLNSNWHGLILWSALACNSCSYDVPVGVHIDRWMGHQQCAANCP